jgi:hypothetical protein
MRGCSRPTWCADVATDSAGQAPVSVRPDTTGAQDPSNRLTCQTGGSYKVSLADTRLGRPDDALMQPDAGLPFPGTRPSHDRRRLLLGTPDRRLRSRQVLDGRDDRR